MKLQPLPKLRLSYQFLLPFLAVFLVLLSIWVMITTSTIKNFGIPAYVVNTSEFDSNHTLNVKRDGHLMLDNKPVTLAQLEVKLATYIEAFDDVNLNIEFEDSDILLKESLGLLSKINQMGITYVIVKVKP